jgi:hypothetical protein
MVKQLPDQVERLALIFDAPSAPATPDRTGAQSRHEAEAAGEEDLTPQAAPAEPLNDRATD